MNVQFLAAAAPMTYLPLFAHVDLQGKLLLTPISTTNYSREDPGGSMPMEKWRTIRPDSAAGCLALRLALAGYQTEATKQTNKLHKR